MKSVFLSPHFPPNFYNFALRLREAGACVLGLSDEPWESLDYRLRDCLNEYYRVSNMHNYEEMVRAFGYFIHRYGLIDHVDSHNEYWLELEAKLRTDFHIAGINMDDIQDIKRKSKMKSRFEAAGLKVARGRVCLTPEETKAFIAEVGYPVCAKPDVGVGAAKTFKIENDSQLEAYFFEKLPVDYIIEEFVSGQIVTFDGLVDKRGEIVFCSSLRYSKGVMEAVNDDTDIYYYICRDIEPALEACGRATLKAFDVRARFFHFEYFILDDGSIMPLEVNMRPPGGLTLDMFNYCFDFDVYQVWAQMLVNDTILKPAGRKHFVTYVGRKDHIGYSLDRNQVMQQYSPLIVHSERLNSVFAQAIGNEGYLLRDPQLEPLIEASEAIQARAIV